MKVAVLQLGSVAFDVDKTLDRLETAVLEAAGNGAQIIVFPEALVGGYPKGLDFGAVVGMRSMEGRNWFARYAENAVRMDGPHMARLCALAADTGVVLHGGLMEATHSGVGGGGTLYCTSVTISGKGELLSKHRKLMPTGMERLIWGFGDGSMMQAAETEHGMLGGAICWENYMPAYRMNQYAQNVVFYCAPTVDDRDEWQHAMHHIAYEGRCFVLAACQYSVRADYPADYETQFGNMPDTVLIRGGSVIIDPLGHVLAAPVYGRAAILYAELDLSLVAAGKYDLDTVGHYSRPDIFSLHVNSAVQKPVVRGAV